MEDPFHSVSTQARTDLIHFFANNVSRGHSTNKPPLAGNVGADGVYLVFVRRSFAHRERCLRNKDWRCPAHHTRMPNARV